MLIKDLVIPIFIAGLFFYIVFSISAYLSGKMLENMFGNENRSTRCSWTGPERSSYIAIAVSTLLFIFSSILLASAERWIIVTGIGLMVFSLMIPSTSSILAFAVMQIKKTSNVKIFADHSSGRHNILPL